MVIKKQPVISWLLGNLSVDEIDKLGVPALSNHEHFGYLANGIRQLGEINNMSPNWGLPELLMPSFVKVMQKSAKSFFNIDHELFLEFGKEELCGILLAKDFGTIVYGFSEDTLYVWLFKQEHGNSLLYSYFYIKSLEDNRRHIATWPTIDSDPQLFNSRPENPTIYEAVSNLLISYLAVKRYVQVETIVIPPNTIAVVDDEVQPYRKKEKVRNDSGQEVIVMDSRWFRKIVNDNDIFGRGFFRMQNKKNASGEWYKELIFVDSFIRHGYHRMAKIEDETVE